MNVEDLLKQKDIAYIPKGGDFVVSCLNPEHPDRNPSMRIDQVTGIFNCFSCEYKGNLFTHFGEKANKMEIKRQLLKKKIDEVRAESVGLQMPEGYAPYMGNWRGITPATYKEFEAFIHSGKDFVEGIFDVMNLHDKGLTNAVCCFGVKNVTEEKLQVLAVSGVEGVDVFLDNDEAGQGQAAKVRELCESVGLDTRNIAFGDKNMDAGALAETQVTKLRDRLYA